MAGRTLTRRIAAVAGAAAAIALPATALAHDLDHQPPNFSTQGPPSLAAQSGGDRAKWEFVTSFPTGNPHTDLDFFSQRGEMYASVGTLAVGPNGGGQSIFKLTNKGRVEPEFVQSVPSASCVSNPEAALGLQHDVEATPKGRAILNTDVLAADRRDTQLIIDATDAQGRCHDQGALGIANAPQGGLEIIDVTDPAHPVTIGLTSHIGEAHTVNIDPKRPHIAYAVTSDSVDVDENGKRLNEDPDESPKALDGFEMVDLSSCMNFKAGTTIDQKQARCRPKVFRYRYPTTLPALGHTNKGTIYGCHELEVYPDDRITCASGGAMIVFSLRGAFDNRGTPANYRDDRPRGTPLPCRVRNSSSTAAFTTRAKVTDCVAGASGADLSVPGWIKRGRPSLAGVKHVGSAFHMGRESSTGAATPAFDSTEDVDFDHEAELTSSGRYVLATDERGGGVAPPGASCSPAEDLPQGNGGIHAYRVDRLLKRRPTSAADAFSSYARGPGGGKAIFRAQVRTKAQASLCTAHVFQQIPGQNRIFMGWYSQGTRVVDFTERSDGTIAFKEAGYFIPENADQWVSHVFRAKRNSDGSFTYWGVAGDFNFGDAGRNAVDVYRVTLPPPPSPRGRLFGIGTGFGPKDAFRISRRGVTLSRKGVARVRVSCRSPLRCRGRLKLRARLRTGGRGRTVTLGSRKFSIPGFKKRTYVKVRLSPERRRLVRRARRARVSARASVRFGSSPRKVVKQNFRLRVKRRP